MPRARTSRGTATDADEGALPTSAMDWNLELQHCPSNCHPHPLQGFTGLGGTFTAPDHEYPSYLTLTLTAKDARGATATQSIRLDPRTVTLALATDPPGLTLSLNGQALTAPAQSTVIAGSLNTVTATDQGSYRFTSWSDDGTASHQVSPMQDSSLTARFEATTPPPPPPPAATQTTGSSSAARAAPATPAAPARGAPAPDDDVVTKQTPPRGSGAVPLLGDDRSPPRRALKGGSRQPALRTGVVRVDGRCPREPCTLRATATLRAKGPKSARRTAASAPVAAGRTGTLVLRLSAKMLKAGRALRGLDRPVEMLVVGAASDRAGNARRAFKAVLLTRWRRWRPRGPGRRSARPAAAAQGGDPGPHRSCPRRRGRPRASSTALA